MRVVEVQARSLRDAALMHEARHIGRNDVFGSIPEMILGFVEPYACRHCFVGNAESTAKTTTIMLDLNQFTNGRRFETQKSCATLKV
jgi:hypothetical protein